MKYFMLVVQPILAILLLLIFADSALAQVAPPPAGGAPLDPVSWTVLAAGGAYAVHRYRKGKKGQEEE